MKKAVLPRLFSAVVSIIVTLVLFDQVATMGQSADAESSRPVTVRPAGYHVAAVGH